MARYLFGLASENSRSERDVACFAAINLAQDSIEIFLLAAADYLNAQINPRTNFEQYLEIINQRISPKELPFRSSLIRINKIRSSSKHDAIRPDVEEIRSLVLVAREFFVEVCRIIFGVEFWTISLIDQLDEGETKNLLKEAENFFTKHEWINCLVRCRQAFFIQFEKAYDIKEFEDPEASKKGIMGPYWSMLEQEPTELGWSNDRVKEDKTELLRRLIENRDNARISARFIYQAAIDHLKRKSDLPRGQRPNSVIEGPQTS